MNDLERFRQYVKQYAESDSDSSDSGLAAVVQFDLLKDWNKNQPSVDRPGIYAIFDESGNLLYLDSSTYISVSWSQFVQYDDDCIRHKIMDDRFSSLRYLLAVMPSVMNEEEIGRVREFLLDRLKPRVRAL